MIKLNINRKLVAIYIGLLFVAESAGNEACKGIAEPEIQNLLKAAKHFEKYVANDAEFATIRESMPISVQKKINAMRVEPIDFSAPKHQLDYKVLGMVLVDTFNDQGEPGRALGSAVKVGRSCIATSAHVLYQSTHQAMSEKHNGPFDKRIVFSRGTSPNVQSFEASVFFQMTRRGEDYLIERGQRAFYGHSDLVILRLSNHSDSYYRRINAISPNAVRNNTAPNIGRSMTCHGYPYYKTSKVYGSCKGSDFAWKQERARVFEDDLSNERGGVASNVASGPGMSGGPCYLDETPDQVFALVSNSFRGADSANPTLPNFEFGGNYAGGNARYLSLFHVLDERMKKELGYGLDQLPEKCK